MKSTQKRELGMQKNIQLQKQNGKKLTVNKC